ncbi:MAG TPA: DUF3048 domain-containing protein [Candidatus Limnocylindrales bacterium]|nr:DUF3048 domain-containing protein [Candidatus Limnocylindrales bacterium]
MHLSSRVRVALAGAAVLVVLAAIGFGIALSGQAGPSPTPQPTGSPTPTATPTPSPSPTVTPTASPTPVAVCPYNGLALDDPSVLDRPAFLVQVENHPAGRPTSGLNAADMVVEAPVEGDTTRFGPVYLCGEAPQAIGPVRSARYYDTDLWQQMHDITIHFGAGWAILRQFNTTGTPYVNGIEGSWPFFIRRAAPAAPHNVYFDLEGIRAAAERGELGDRVAGAGTPRAPFVFDAEAEPPAGRTIGSVTIYTNEFWSFGWSWDAGGARWLRSDAGAPATDALTGEPLTATTVVVQLVEQTILYNEPDPGGYPRRRQHLVGSGDGVLYLDGQAHDVRWSRAAADDVTTWTYADSGEPMLLPPGKVWWEIVPIGSSITER